MRLVDSAATGNTLVPEDTKVTSHQTVSVYNEGVVSHHLLILHRLSFVTPEEAGPIQDHTRLVR